MYAIILDESKEPIHARVIMRSIILAYSIAIGWLKADWRVWISTLLHSLIARLLNCLTFFTIIDNHVPTQTLIVSY